jgi:hypothetical protein
MTTDEALRWVAAWRNCRPLVGDGAASVALADEVERLRALLAEARERELRYVLPLYRDKNYIARLDSAINAAKKEG